MKKCATLKKCCGNVVNAVVVNKEYFDKLPLPTDSERLAARSKYKQYAEAYFASGVATYVPLSATKDFDG